jgi:hypothetical protein
MFTTAAKNTMLDALTFSAASLHTGYPGSTGANEVSGGSYARQTPSVGAASGEVRTAASNSWPVPAGTTVRWVGYWNASTFLACAPNGGNPKEFVATPGTDMIASPAHGYADTQPVVFYGGTVPGGLSEGAVYFVRDSTTDTFKVAATSGGAAIDITSAGGSGCQVSAIAQDVYASADTHTISAATFGLPF